MTLGDRLEASRAWTDGTFAPERSKGYPTIHSMPRVPVSLRVPATVGEIITRSVAVVGLVGVTVWAIGRDCGVW